MSYLRLVALTIALTALPGIGETHPSGHPRVCEAQADCPGVEFCQGGLCQRAPAVGDHGPLFGLGLPEVLAPLGSDDEAHAARLSRKLRRTLGMLGPFVIVKTRAGDSPSPEPPTITGIDVEGWHQAGAHALLLTAVWSVQAKASEEPQVTLEARLVELARGRSVPLAAARQSLRHDEFGRGVARLADEIVLHYTGRPGLIGTRIAYTKRLPGGAQEIFSISLSGDDERQETRNGSLNLFPTWTPEGTLAYTSFIDGNPDLWLGEKKLSSRKDLNTGAAISPDGRTVALTLGRDGNAEIYLICRHSGALVRRLTDHPAIDTSPTWSPDGSRLAFVSDRSGVPQIYVMNSDGSGVRALTTSGYNTNPCWSPVADVVVFDRLVAGQGSDIFAVNVDTTEILRLTDSPWSNESPSFSPDGRQIAFASNRDGESQIFVMNADGRNLRRLTAGAGPNGAPAWSTLAH